MEQIFLKVLNISISASILIIVVIAARLLLKKAPKWCVMLLWAIVALRLVIPVSIESAFSLIPRGMDEKIESIEAAVMDRNTDQEQIPQAEANNMPMTVTGDIQEDVTYNPYEIVEITEPVKPEFSIFEIAGYIWVTGVGLMLMFSLFSYIKLKLRMAESVKYKDNIYLSDRTATALILGMIRTRIYLPSGINEKEIPYVIAHEFSHIKRGDHLWKPLAYFLLCVYWFNPLMWIAYSLLSRDIEYACDEKTVSGYDMKDRKAYAAALLENSIQKKLVMVCPLAFGEGSIKERVRKVLDHKKPAFWICIVSLAVVVIVGGCFATKPENDGNPAAQEEAGVTTEDEAIAVSQDTVESETTMSIAGENREWNWPTIHKYGIGTRSATDAPDYIEIHASYLDPAFAACTGDIVETGNDAEWGNYIVQDIGDSVTLKYGHLKDIYVNKGEHAEAGRVIGNISEDAKPVMTKLFFAIYDNGVAVDPLAVTDDWKYVEYEDLKLLNSSLEYRVSHYLKVEKTGIRLNLDSFGFDEQGGVIKLVINADDRIYDDAVIQSPEFQEMVNELSVGLNSYLDEVFSDVLEDRIDKNRYRVETEILLWPWENDKVIERLKEEGKL